MTIPENLININPAYLYNFDIFMTPEIINKFRGVKYILMQGSSYRTKILAQKLAKLILDIEPDHFMPTNLFKASRFECYRIGDVLSVSHGMGTVSVMNLLNDCTKLMTAAGNSDFEYIRIGTSGGINIEPGSVIITETSFGPDLKPGYKINTLGKDIIYSTQMDSDLNKRILQAQPDNLTFKLYKGNSITSDDFYMGQARFDGAIKPEYNHESRNLYFKKAMELNILNFEMESSALAAFCGRANIPATMIAVTLVNRLQSDQVALTSEEVFEFSDRAQLVAINYITKERSIQTVFS